MMKSFHLQIAGQTDVGRVRANNEDAFCNLQDMGLLLVADGMGGHASGEVASKLAIDIIREYFAGAMAGSRFIGTYDEDLSEDTNRLGSAVRLANEAIFEASQSDAQWKGMGTTIVAALIRGNKLSIAHVGDSRIYLIRAGNIEQLTDDHSVVAEQVKRELISRDEANKSEIKNILTRALGTEAEVEVDIEEMNLLNDDILLLCSDGLSNMISDDEILTVALSDKDPVLTCKKLVNIANDNGGKDNITVVVAHLVNPGWFASLIKFFKWRRR
jgi:protein phosphatase